MIICIRCGKEKGDTEFPIHPLYVRKVCRECEKPNLGRLKKGNIPKCGFNKGHIPWSKGKKMSQEFRAKCGLKNKGRKLTEEHKAKVSKALIEKGKSRTCVKYKNWQKQVLEKGNYKCSECGCENKNILHAHHIMQWGKSTDLRFDVNNGEILCRVCHAKLEGFQKEHISKIRFDKGNIPWSKGKRFPGKTNKGSFKKGNIPKVVFNKGHIPWNAGKHISVKNKRTCKLCGIEKDIEEFPKMIKKENGNTYRRYKCRKCYNSIARDKYGYTKQFE